MAAVGRYKRGKTETGEATSYQIRFNTKTLVTGQFSSCVSCIILSILCTLSQYSTTSPCNCFIGRLMSFSSARRFLMKFQSGCCFHSSDRMRSFNRVCRCLITANSVLICLEYGSENSKFLSLFSSATFLSCFFPLFDAVSPLPIVLVFISLHIWKTGRGKVGNEERED